MTKKVDKTILISIFRRSGSEGNKTKLFQNHDNQVKAIVSKVLIKNGISDPILLHYNGDKNFTVISEKQTISVIDGEYSNLLNLNIASVSFDMIQALHDNANTAFDLSHIRVKQKSGEEMSIEFENGFPLSGALNLLKYFERINSSI